MLQEGRLLPGTTPQMAQRVACRGEVLVLVAQDISRGDVGVGVLSSLGMVEGHGWNEGVKISMSCGRLQLFGE